jgi:SAM-dependent methyltransferase
VSAYALGDSEVAADRLELVAEVFDRTSRAFLQRFARHRVRLALDLGCGPGHTTRLLADEIRPRRTIGLDSSEAFLRLARQRASEEISFRRHDVTALPFPVGPADLLYGRFLLSHVQDPERLVPAWATQLARGGLLLVDEVERITTSHPVFRRYLDLVRTVLARRGHALEVSPRLDAVHDAAGLHRLESRVVTLDPPVNQVTRMFLMNLEALRGACADSELDRLAREIAEVRAGEVRWELRQLVFEVAGPP